MLPAHRSGRGRCHAVLDEASRPSVRRSAHPLDAWPQTQRDRPGGAASVWLTRACPTRQVPYTRRVGRTLIERRLRDVSERMKQVGRELSVVEEQLAHLVDEADEARIRALVSETPLAGHDHHEAQRHADAMSRHRDSLVAELAELDQTQNELLDRLMTTAPSP